MKKFLAVALALIMVFAFAACADTTTESPDTSATDNVEATAAGNTDASANGDVFKVGVCARAFSSPWQTYCYEVMENIAAENPNIELDIQDGNEDANVQMNILQTFIEQKKDLVVVFANQEDTLVGAVNQVAEAGIPVINTQGYVGDGADLLTFIGSDDWWNGYYQGKVLHELLEKDGKEEGNIILIQALLGTTYTIDRTKGLEDYLAENLPNVKIVAYEAGDNDNAKTVTAMQNLLTRFPEGTIDAVVVQGPHDCVAAADAAIDAGREELRGKFVAMDYATTVEKAIKDGRVYGTVDQDPGMFGEKTMELILAYVNGEMTLDDFEDNYILDFPTVTQANIEEYGSAHWD
jgi:ribose transport system substrate-binding protein